MCGIVGYVGPEKAQDIIYRGLSRLEYRGYDSAGIAVLSEENGKSVTRIIKAPGKLKELKPLWSAIDVATKLGIGHTRWATHGQPNQPNAHPHKVGGITLVHNGIIENHSEIRAELRKKGVSFLSETDTELFAHLVHLERKQGKGLLEAVRISFMHIKGASAFVVIDEESPGTIVVVRNGSPLVLGLGAKENLVASDVPALLEVTRQVYYLQDNELAVLNSDGIKVFGMDGQERRAEFIKIDWDIAAIDKRGYEHFMLKEIHEQPQAIQDTASSWIDVAGKRFSLEAVSVARVGVGPKRKYNHQEICELFTKARQVHIVACGTAWHAGLYGQMLLERIAGVSARTELASEFRYREPVLHSNDIGLVVSQSGETADTLAAVKLMKERGLKVFVICNVRDASIVRECDGVFYTNAGIEVGVASTKAFTTQLVLFAVLAAAIGRHNGMLSAAGEAEWVQSILDLPKLAQIALEEAADIKKLAHDYLQKKGFLFLGRGLHYPIALEGALKLKEIAYVHAEGYPSGELKHGPIAMVEPEMLIISLSPEGTGLVHEKSISNFEEVRARKGTILGIGAANDTHFRSISNNYLSIPHIQVAALYPILAIIPLQLLAYYSALARGTEVDQPRNLAKSVTVE